jgi:hypothetical protein
VPTQPCQGVNQRFFVFLSIDALNKHSLLRANSRKEDVIRAIAELVLSISKAFEQLAITLTGLAVPSLRLLRL